MKIRRVVTGLDASGHATVVSDGPAPRSHDLVSVPGMSTSMLWATAPGEPIRLDGSDPTPGVRRQLPEPGGTCFLIIRFPPDSAYASPSFDAAAASAERRIAFPGVAELLEPDHPGMHTTESVDYVLVLDGELWLELDDGRLTRLGPGDTVVQNGTRHAWRNLGAQPATVAVVQVGAERAG
jgi:mannose-6-phosphate isomerase-like protein (cupin superfamily)